MANKALGKGLGALIPEGVWGKQGGVAQIRIADISPNPYQPRKKLDEEKLAELVASVRKQGVLQPVLVRRSGAGYELVAGERRFRAAERLGMASIPAMVREVSDGQALELSLVENLQRDDLNAMEEALGYQRLREEFGMTQEALAVAMGKDRSSVANTLRLLGLAGEVRRAVSDGKLKRGHALALAGVAGEREQKMLARKIISRGLSVRQAEAMARRVSARRRGPAPRRDPHMRAAEDKLRKGLGTRVLLRGTPRRGKIEIRYEGLEELERILGVLLGPDAVREHDPV